MKYSEALQKVKILFIYFIYEIIRGGNMMDYKRKAADKSLLMILAFCSFFIGLDSLVVAPLIPEITKTTNTSIEQGGLLITAYALFYGVFAPLFGPISDKVGRKKMIVLGMLLFSFGTLCTGVTHNYYNILIFRSITGLSGAIVMPSIFALVGDKFQYQSRGMAMGIIMGAMIGSTVIGVPAGALVTQLTSWQWTFYGIGFLALLVTWLAYLGLPKTPPTNKIVESIPIVCISSFKKAFSNTSIFFALLTTLLWTFGLYAMFSYIGVYYKINFQLTVAEVGLVLLVAGLASVLGNIIGGKLADKLGKKVVISIASLISSVGVIGFSLLTNTLIGAILAHVIWSTSIGFGQSSLTALISELNPKVRGTVLSLNSSAMYFGMTIASSLSSLLLTKNFSFLSIGLFCAIASILVLPMINYLVKEQVVINEDIKAKMQN